MAKEGGRASWREAGGADFLFGMARNQRLRKISDHFAVRVHRKEQIPLKLLLVSHPEGPFEAVAEFETFVDDCFRNLYDAYFHFQMLTWKFEIFEDFECTKPMPITNEDRYTEFTYLVLN